MTISERVTEHPPLDSSGGLLDALRESRRREQAEAALQLRLAVAYAAFNSPDSIHPAATFPGTEGELLRLGFLRPSPR
jgi:hypothetical protein